MNKVPHHPAVDNYIVLLGAHRPHEEVKLIVATAEELVTPGGDLTVVHLEAAVHGLIFQGRIALRTYARLNWHEYSLWPGMSYPKFIPKRHDSV